MFQGGFILERENKKDSKLRLDKIIGLNIRRERTLRGVSREELASMLGLTISHLGLIERGERGATSVVIEKLTETFKVSIDNLFKEHTRTSLRRNKENRAPLPDTLKNRITTLAAQLSDAELIVLEHTITGILSMRKFNKLSEEVEE